MRDCYDATGSTSLPGATPRSPDSKQRAGRPQDVGQHSCRFESLGNPASQLNWARDPDIFQDLLASPPLGRPWVRA